MRDVDKWVSIAFGVGVFMFLVFNASNVIQLAEGAAKTTTQFIGGIATVGRGM